MKHSFFLPAVLSLFLSLPAFSQFIPVNPKMVTRLEAEFSVYEPDTTASAVLLFHGEDIMVRFNSDLEFIRETTVHDRYKILSDAGKQYADFNIIIDPEETVSDIKVETYNIEDGKLVKTKMSKKSVFKEKMTEKLDKITFAAENVKVGSVVDVYYVHTAPTIGIQDVYFQKEIPVNSEEVSVTYAEYLSYNRVQRGFITIEQGKDWRNTTISINGRGNLTYDMVTDKYKAKDVPALKRVPYLYCPEQFRSSVVYDVRGLAIPGVLYRTYGVSWDSVDAKFRELNFFSECYSKFRDMDGLKEAVEGVGEEEEKVVAVRRWINSKVAWNKKVRLRPDPVKKALKDGTASNAEINTLVASALNSIGFMVDPVLVKRRTSGFMVDYQVSIESFDTFILRVKSPEGNIWFLDAATPDGYLNVLPPDFLVSQGRLLPVSGPGQWVSVADACKGNSLMKTVRAEVSGDGTMRGAVAVIAKGECSYDVKKDYGSYDNEEGFIDDIANEEHLVVDEFRYNGEYSPGCEYEYTFEKDVEAGERIYLKPFLSPLNSHTAFSRETRNFPVEIPYPHTLSYSFMLSVPEGYEVEELPPVINYNKPSVGGKVQLMCRHTGGPVMVFYKFSLNTYIITAEHYQELREFWQAMASAEDCTIVLRKK